VCRSLSPLGSLATSSRSTPPALFGCCGICVFLPPAPLPPIPPGRALSRRGPMACHGEGACAQALTEPRRDYLARLPGGRKTPQQPAGGVEEVAPQWCGTQPTVKDRSTNSGAQRPAGGVGARRPHTARQPTPVPLGTSVRLLPCTRIPGWWESGCRVAPPGCAVTEQRCAWHPRMPSRHTLPQWHLLGRPWRAAHAICCGVHVLGTMADTSRPTVRARPRRGPTSARGLALTQEPSGMTLRSRAGKEKSP
jgi:hypothetical protein